MNRIERLRERPRRPEQLDLLLGSGWPAFIEADRLAAKYLDRVRAGFADLELVVLDDSDTPVAAGWAVPLHWDGTVGDLPGGYADSLRRAVETLDAAGPTNTLVVCAAQVHPAHRGQGLASVLLKGFRDLSEERGESNVIVPLRPTMKTRYPLTGIEVFTHWQRPDGSPLDPWLRTHVRMGARVLAPAPRSQVMTGTVAEWEAWTGMVFPSSGDYVIPDGLAPLHIDLTGDVGEYVEPNIWVQHR